MDPSEAKAELDRAVEQRKADFVAGCPKPCRSEIERLTQHVELLKDYNGFLSDACSRYFSLWISRGWSETPENIALGQDFRDRLKEFEVDAS